MAANIGRVIGAALLVLLGVARGVGGIALIAEGPGLIPGTEMSPASAAAVGVGLLLVMAVCLGAGVALWVRHPRAHTLALVALVFFVVDGLFNGTIMYGAPRSGGTLANTILAVVIAFIVRLGRSEKPGVPEASVSSEPDTSSRVE